LCDILYTALNDIQLEEFAVKNVNV